jgi:hypothetical protein
MTDEIEHYANCQGGEDCECEYTAWLEAEPAIPKRLVDEAREQSDRADYWHAQFEERTVERDALRKTLAGAWSAYLDLALDTRLDDGTLMLDVVFDMHPTLRNRLVETIYKPRGPKPGEVVWTPPTAPEADPVHRPGRRKS